MLRGRALGPPMDGNTCANAAEGGYLAVLQWAPLRAAHGTRGRALMRLEAATSRAAGAHSGLPMGREDDPCCAWPPPRGAAVGAQSGLPNRR